MNKNNKKTSHKTKKSSIVLGLALAFLILIFIAGKCELNKQHEEYLNSPRHQELVALNQKATKNLVESYLLNAKVDVIGTSYHDSVEKEMDEIQDLLDEAFDIAATSPKNRSEEDNKRLEALIALINSHGIVELEIGKDGYIDIISEE